MMKDQFYVCGIVSQQKTDMIGIHLAEDIAAFFLAFPFIGTCFIGVGL
jgi:hypothetical protein